MRSVIQSILGGILIILGLFLLFALAFNGSVGETFVNYSFFTSASLMIAFGISKLNKIRYPISMGLGITSMLLYFPMIWQRFNFKHTDVSTGIYFDMWVIAILLISLIIKPNKSSKRDAIDGAPS